MECGGSLRRFHPIIAIFLCLLSSISGRPCDVPASVPNGQLVYGPNYDYEDYLADPNKSKPGDLISVVCDYGFELVGEGNGDSTCTPNGTWDPPIYSCSRKGDASTTQQPPAQCSIPLIMNGKVSQGGSVLHSGMLVNPGSIVDVSCDIGYNQIGDAVLKCLVDSKWRGRIPVCIAADVSSGAKCRVPNVPNSRIRHLRNSVSEGDEIEAGQEISIGCQAGYRKIGEKYIRCQNNGLWNHPPPECRSSFQAARPTKCVLAPIPNGAFYEYPAAPSNADSGNGDASDYSYDYSETTTAAPNTPVKVRELALGASAEVKCNSGYEIDGTSSLVNCGLDGALSSIPLCVSKTDPRPAGCRVPLIPGARVKLLSDEVDAGVVIDVDKEVSIGCTPGKERKGEEYLKCMANGTWNHPIPKCKPKEDDQISPCDLPGIANGKYQDTYGGDGYDYDDYAYGESNTDTTGITTLDREADVEVVCTDGFQLVGPSTVKCYLNRTLSEIPTCAKIRCRVQALQNGAIAVGNIAAPSQVDFNVTLTASCDPGYTLIGTDRLVCEEKGEFDEKFPKCITNTTAFCTIPTIPNGRPASLRPGLNAATDDTVTVLCQKGYLVDTRTNVSRCGQNGAWLPKYPQCLIAKCNAEQRITDGMIHLDGNQAPRFVEYDVNVTVVCDQGFRLVDGPETLQCGEDGTFTSKFPRCVQENTDSCRVNEMMDNHTIINTNLTVISSGQRVQISCVDGFVFVSTLGDKFFNCDEGVWRQRQSMPVCIADPKCTLPEIKNGDVDPAIYRRGRENSILVNDTAHVRCTGGYILQGNPTLKCVEVEKFKDPLVPTCVPVSIQCTVPAVSHGEVVNESDEVIQAESRVTANTKVFVRCQGSEVISSENNGSRCLPNGNWDPELPATCFRAEAFSVSNDQVTEGNGTANQNVYIGIGVCVVLAIIVAVVAFFLHRRRNRKKSDMERIVENCHDNMTYMSAVEAGGAVTVRYVRKSPNGSADNGVTQDDGYLVMKDQPCEHEVPGTSHLRQTHVRDSVPADFGDDDAKRESVVTFKPAYRESSTQETNSTHSTEGKM